MEHGLSYLKKFKALSEVYKSGEYKMNTGGLKEAEEFEPVVKISKQYYNI
jgi:hypothetical protein